MHLVRIGTCNNCGTCCRQNDPFLGVPQQCAHYQENGPSHCKIYPIRPNVCRAAPLTPRDTACTPKCGFQFVDELSGKPVDAYMMQSTASHLKAAARRKQKLYS